MDELWSKFVKCAKKFSSENITPCFSNLKICSFQVGRQILLVPQPSCPSYPPLKITLNQNGSSFSEM